MLTDYHLHTTFSLDGHQTPEELCRRAEALGVRYLAITDHVDVRPTRDNRIFDILDPVAYRKGIDRLKEDFPRLSIQRGMEMGYIPEWWSEILTRIQTVQPQFVLGSLHFVGLYDPYDDEYWEHRTRKQGYDDYLHLLNTAVDSLSKVAQALAHFDYCSKFVKFPDPELRYEDHADLVDPILQKLIRADMALEINTSGYKSRPAPLPGPSILARYYKLGGRKIVFGSDGHYTEFVAYEMERAHRLARDIGFTRHSVWIDGQERQFSL